MSEATDRLGVNPDATEEEIKRAFHKLAFDTHPDRGGNPDAFMLLDRAYREALQERAGRSGGTVPPGTVPPGDKEQWLSEDGWRWRCAVCHGKGKVSRTEGFSALVLPCEACDGTGN